MNFTFVSESTDDIKTGLQPFIIADGSAEHRQANLELACTYGMLQAEEHSLLFSDLQALQAKETQSIPLSYFELECNLGMFGSLLGTALGSVHILTTTYHAFWTLLPQGYCQEMQQIIDVRRHIKPAHVLHSIQLICFKWFTLKQAYLTPPPPDFKGILSNITLITYVLPNIPPFLYKLAYPKLPTTTSLASSSQTSPTLTLTSGSNSSGTASSSASTISGLTIPSLPGTWQRGTHIAKLAPDPSLVTLLPQGIKIRALMGTDPPPTLDNGSPICMSYLHQGCWSTCSRASTHANILNAAEHAPFVTYLCTQVQKYRAQTQGNTQALPQATQQITQGSTQAHTQTSTHGSTQAHTQGSTQLPHRRG